MRVRLETDHAMPFIYCITGGELIHYGKIVGRGYSGLGDCKNDPLSTHIPNLGPIPSGAYFIGPETIGDEHGPVAMHLIQLSGTETFGRSAFMIHGDSQAHPGRASHGCIVFDRPTRELIASNNRDRQLIVLPSLWLVTPQECGAV